MNIVVFFVAVGFVLCLLALYGLLKIFYTSNETDRQLILFCCPGVILVITLIVGWFYLETGEIIKNTGTVKESKTLETSELCEVNGEYFVMDAEDNISVFIANGNDSVKTLKIEDSYSFLLTDDDAHDLIKRQVTYTSESGRFTYTETEYIITM